MDIWEYDSYKLYLRDLLRIKKRKIGNQFTYQKMAEGCGIQKTYLSRVLNSEFGHLSSDQLYGGCEFLAIPEKEREYLFLLREHEQSQLQSRREEISSQISELRSQIMKTDAHISEDVKSDDSLKFAHYYLEPNVLLTHIFLSVERYRSNIKMIRDKLDISEAEFSVCLNTLEQMGLIAVGHDGYTIKREKSHLPSNSFIYKPYRALQRLKALERIQKLSEDQAYTFSVVFSATLKEKKLIQKKFLSMLKEISNSVSNAPGEEVFQMNFDLFDWSL